MKSPRPLIIPLTTALLIGAVLVYAQDAPTPVPTAAQILIITPPPTDAPAPPTATPAPVTAETCADSLVGLYIAATEACINKPVGYVCNAGAPLSGEPQGGVSNALAAYGALVDAAEVDALASAPFTPETASAGIAYLRPNDPLLYTAFVLGDMSLRDVSPPEFPAWTSFTVETGAHSTTCPSAPTPTLIVQTQPGYGVRIVVNGISLFLNGTVLVQTDPVNSTFVTLSGVASVLTGGQEQPMNVGEQVSVGHAADNVGIPNGIPSAPVPYNPALVANLPIALFDRPILLPQPGYVVTQGAVNLRIEPTTDAAVLVQVPAGEVLSVLGASADSAWYHVRRDTGETGWMFAQLLGQNLGLVSAVYSATPLPPQRYGELGTSGRVIAPAGASLRSGPDQIFPAIASLNDGQPVTLIARSPYSPWVKVDTGGAIGWLALINLDTQAYIDALPVDYQAPNIPTPTIPPGSFGNAFPDPNTGGNE
jgi:uncharacterized protein YraI